MTAVFLFGQSYVTGHAHEHLDEAPDHKPCAVCVVVINNDSDSSVLDVNNLDGSNLDAVWDVFENKALLTPKTVPSSLSGTASVDPPPKPYLRVSSVRAPPAYTLI